MQKIETSHAPKAIGPYSQAVLHNGFVFVSGQLPVDPKTGKLVEGGIEVMTNQVFDNLESILKEAGSSLEKMIRSDVFLTNLNDFAAMNRIYAKRITGPVLPARQTIQVAALPMNAIIEISCIAAT